MVEEMKAASAFIRRWVEKLKKEISRCGGVWDVIRVRKERLLVSKEESFGARNALATQPVGSRAQRFVGSELIGNLKFLSFFNPTFDFADSDSWLNLSVADNIYCVCLAAHEF